MSPNEKKLVKYITVLEEVRHQDENEPTETAVLYRNQEFMPGNRSTVYLDEAEQEFYPPIEDVPSHTEHDSDEDILRLIVPMSVSNEENLLVSSWMAASMTDLFTRMACTDLTLGLKAPGDAGYLNPDDEHSDHYSKFSRTEIVTLYRNDHFVDDHSSVEVFVEDHRSSTESEDFTVEIDSDDTFYMTSFHHERNLFLRTWQRVKNLFACVTK